MDARKLRKGDKCLHVYSTDMGKWVREPVTVANELHRTTTTICYPPQNMGDVVRGVPNGPGVEKVHVDVVTAAGKTKLVREDDLEPIDE